MFNVKFSELQGIRDTPLVLPSKWKKKELSHFSDEAIQTTGKGGPFTSNPFLRWIYGKGGPTPMALGSYLMPDMAYPFED